MEKPSMVTVRHIKAARALLLWSQHDLARKSKVSVPTIERLEAVDGDLGGRPKTAEKIEAALKRAGIELLNHGEPGVRLRKRPR
jgi:ribosome-binding protein aMBF1 (putative translation factor)